MKFRRTQTGNNNAYCHDNEITWLDWSLVTSTPMYTASPACSLHVGCCET